MDVLFQPLFDVHGRRTTHPSSGDGLFVARVDDIPRRKHTGHRGHGVFFVNDVTFVIGFDLVSEEIGDGCVADGDERPGGLDGLRASVKRVFEDGSGQTFVVRKPLLDLPERLDLNFGMVGRSLVHDG